MIKIETFTAQERQKLAAMAKNIPELISSSFRSIKPGATPIIPAGGGYFGIWQEHNQDCYFLAESFPQEAWASMEVFMEFQMQNGLMPCAIGFEPTLVNYGQLQVVWPFARCAYEIIKKTSRGKDDIRRVYDAAMRYDAWIMEHRNHNGHGLVEMYSEFDTGHDNSPRVTDGGIGHQSPGVYAGNMPDLPCMPIIAADLSAARCQALTALAEMAEVLDLAADAEKWRARADQLKARIMEILYDPADEFFYDRSPDGFRKYRSEHITRLFLNRVVDQELFDRIYQRYFENEKEFLTPWPFPSMSVGDPAWQKEVVANCWGRNTQALTQLRAILWMDHYGRSRDLEGLMSLMLRNYLEFPQNRFSQEIDPFTGVTTNPSSHDYQPALLFFLLACRRLDIIG